MSFFRVANTPRTIVRFLESTSKFRGAKPLYISTVTLNPQSQSRAFSKTRTSYKMPAATTTPAVSGDLNNTSAMRLQVELEPDAAYFNHSLEITASEDDPEIRSKYRPFLLDTESTKNDWISKLELSTAMKMAEDDLKRTGSRLKILMLYGSMRSRSASSPSLLSPPNLPSGERKENAPPPPNTNNPAAPTPNS